MNNNNNNPDIETNARYAKTLPQLPAAEVQRRLAKVVPFCVFEERDPADASGQRVVRNCWAIEPVAPGKAYMWEHVKTNEFLGVLYENAGGIYGPPDADGRMEQLMDVRSYLTLHTYGWYGFFKPDILEVVQQLPDALFDDYDKIYVTTTPMSTDINRLMTPCDFHMGKTTVAVEKRAFSPRL
ncbi:hypothetical protein QKT49_gp448 [Acanthamoeba castellanii medusavirus]|uniref:Uncharacterized protein n=1 Tax=Acanthamoeba castellanii medusavirus J1 TaxID=3114988 RepID=A0A3T1CWY2_9VIRU|nr:hypothetical protein QKT49_gp448 [Acanthamoeba castellanii medusavirus]BBI30315.1 hypothetical protein [Acanthamoeba castellanii medusavirus J1]